MVTSNLRKILRFNDSLEEVASAAKTLAQCGDMSELYCMASGGYRRGLSWYNPTYMVIAMEALIESGLPESKIFLKHLLKTGFDHLVSSEKKYGDYYREEYDVRPNLPAKFNKAVKFDEGLNERVRNVYRSIQE